MERYKSTFQKKNWITLKLSEMDHVKEIQAISFIWNHLKRQNALSGTAQEHKKEADTKIVIQKIIGLLSSGHNVKQIANILREDLYFVQLISTIYQQEFQLHENLRLSDLTKNMGLSDFSKPFAKETNKLMGNAPSHSKLVQTKINKEKDYVTFMWVTARTPKYPNNQKMQAVDPENFELKPSPFYTIEIRILDFFKLLQQRANEEDITDKDIEDVMYKADIQIWDSTPSFQYQGSNYILTMFDAAIHPETREPKRWNKYHDDNNFLSKHGAQILTNIKFYLPQMRQMIKKYLRIK